jgi:quercetin dioxygenase-like cupin family protein
MRPAKRSRPDPAVKRPGRRLATACLAVLLSLQPVLATPPTEGVHFVNYTLSIDPDATDRVQIRLPAALEYEEDAPISRATRSPSVFVFEDNTFDPNANTGWHYHPGIVLVTMSDGQLDWYDANCVRHIRKAGDFFVENNRQVHLVRNSTSTPARQILTFIIAKGLTFKIPVPAPACAAALGLN